MNNHHQQQYVNSSIWLGKKPLARLYLWYLRKAPSHPSKLRIVRFLTRSFFARGITLQSSSGAVIQINPNDLIGQLICTNGAYEPQSLQLATRLMQPGGTFLDVGSNFGLYTFTVGMLSGVKCLAIDASPHAFVQLTRNANLNPSASVTMVNIAVGSESGFVQLETPSSDNLGSTRVNTAQLNKLFGHFTSCLQLRDVLKWADVKNIKLMKIDIEGAEYNAFLGLFGEAGFYPENIIMEYNVQLGLPDSALEKCEKLLRHHGYAPWTVTEKPILNFADIPEANVWWRRR